MCVYACVFKESKSFNIYILRIVLLSEALIMQDKIFFFRNLWEELALDWAGGISQLKEKRRHSG